MSCDTGTVDGKLPHNFMYESFKRLSQAIKDALPANESEARKNQSAAALVVNSVGVMSQPKRGERSTAFSEAVDTLGEAIQAARATKQAKVQDTKKTEATQPAKSLAELLAESAQDSEENE